MVFHLKIANVTKQSYSYEEKGSVDYNIKKLNKKFDIHYSFINL